MSQPSVTIPDTTGDSIAATFAWPLALAAAALLGTLLSACMMPFVAIAVAGAATMTRAQAAITIVGIWAINQMLGFGLLGFPLDAYTIGWGAALGLASLGTMFAAAAFFAGRPALGWRLPLAFVLAFALYEAALFAFALLVGGTGTFTPSIVGQILFNDAVCFAVLISLHFVLTRAAPRWFGPGLAVGTA